MVVLGSKNNKLPYPLPNTIWITTESENIILEKVIGLKVNFPTTQESTQSEFKLSSSRGCVASCSSSKWHSSLTSNSSVDVLALLHISRILYLANNLSTISYCTMSSFQKSFDNVNIGPNLSQKNYVNMSVVVSIVAYHLGIGGRDV